MTGLVELVSGRLSATVDLGRGAEIASIRDLPTNTEILMITPWAEHARTVRPVRLAHPASVSEAAWMESYAGGWQTLFPHAGPPVVTDGYERHYHGEASSIPWSLDAATATEVAAHAELFTVPVRVDRVVNATGGCITVTDVLTNTSDRAVTYDYQSHPAFGAPFIEEGCTIETDAATYVPDRRLDLGEFAPGQPVRWPTEDPSPGEIDLRAVPGPTQTVIRFGWLEDFTARRVAITNPRLGLRATLEWPEPERSLAWLWEEIHAHPFHPWFGRGYSVAVEPSTRTTSGGGLSPQLQPRSRATYQTKLTLSTLQSNDTRVAL
jgi:hypothetical protein